MTSPSAIESGISALHQSHPPCKQEIPHQRQQQQQNPSNALATGIKTEHFNKLKILLIFNNPVCAIMQKIFTYGAPEKCMLQTLKGYLTMAKMSKKQYRATFNRTNRKIIDSDPACSSFDVSLWYVAIQWGCEGLASARDNTWNSSPDTLENHLKRIRDLHNDVMHTEFSTSTQAFLDECEVIRDLLVNTLEKAKNKYGIDPLHMKELVDDMNTNLNHFKDTPLTHIGSECYESLHNLMMDICVKDVLKYFEKMSHVNPSSMITGSNVLLWFQNIFTKLEICQVGKYDKHETIDHTDLLEYAHQIKEADGNSFGQISLIEGAAGVGKTTLVNFIISDWLANNSSVKEIKRYKFLFHVECRSISLESFSDLMEFQMPTARSHFHDGNHMMRWVLEHPCLIIVDGLDEMNIKSKKLFIDILGLLHNNDIFVLCTTRRVKVNDYYQMVPINIRTMHVKIKGLAPNAMISFVVKYHEELKRKGFSTRSTNGLVKYLEKTEAHLQDHLQFPFNLEMLTCMWAVDPSRVNSVITGIELYKQNHELILLKLYERIGKDKLSQSMDESVIKRNLQIFIDALGWEALVGLRDDTIILSNDILQHLEDVCALTMLPKREVFAAFLVQDTRLVPTGLITEYTFPHKFHQEFYAGLYIAENVTKNNDLVGKENSKKNITQLLSKSNLAYHRWKKFIQLLSGSGSTTILDCFKHLHKANLGSLSLHKYINVLVMLLGIFHQSPQNIVEKLASEMVELLKRAGVCRCEDWIRILNKVKVDAKVATLICQLPEIIKGTLDITDANLCTYTTLLNEIMPKRVSIKISTNLFKAPRLNTLLEVVKKYSCEVEHLSLWYLYLHPDHPFIGTSLGDAVIQLLKSCKVKVYVGRMTTELPMTLDTLRVSVANLSSFQDLLQYLHSRPTRLEFLGVCISLKVDSTCLAQLLDTTNPGGCLLHLRIPDVREIDIETASEIARKLQPTEGRKRYRSISFQRGKLNSEGQKQLILRLKDVKTDLLVFPESCQPSSDEDQEEIKELGMDQLQCNVKWSANEDR